jgi:hypothetical protein
VQNLICRSEKPRKLAYIKGLLILIFFMNRVHIGPFFRFPRQAPFIRARSRKRGACGAGPLSV